MATFDWSFDLLTEAERRVFSRLSVFVGGWSLSSAISICELDGMDQTMATDILGTLVDKSLVQAEPVPDGGVRYRLLETLRDYATEKLLSTGTAETASARHAHVMTLLDIAEAAPPRLSGPEQVSWLTCLELEHDNIKAGLNYLLEDAQDHEMALRLAVALRPFWFIRGYFREGVGYLERALDTGASSTRSDSELVASALIAVGALLHPPETSAKSWLEQGLAMARRLGAETLVADALCELAWVEFCHGDRADALALADDAIGAAHAVGDLDLLGFAKSIRGTTIFSDDQVTARADFDESIRCFSATHNSERLSSVLCRLAIHELEVGHLETASVHLARVLDIAIEVQNAGLLPFAYSALGLCAYLNSDNQLARTRFVESLACGRRVEDGNSMAYALLGVAFCATATGDPDAAKLHGAADALLADCDQGLESPEAELREQDHAHLRLELGDDTFDDLYNSGWALPRTSAIALASTQPRTNIGAESVSS